MVVTENEPKEFRYGVPAEMYDEWIKLHERTGIPQKQIVHRLVRFILEQDELVQGVILSGVPVTAELHRLLLNKLMDRAKANVGGKK